MHKFTAVVISIVACGTILRAQEASGIRTHVSFEYGVQFPGADMAEVFGTNFNLGSQFEVMLNKSLWHAGVKGYFLFGSRVKQDVLSNLRTPEGFIIGNDRSPANVFLRERGFFIGPYIGKVIRFSENNPHSGLKLSIGGGLLQYKVRLQDDTRSVVQITGEYAKGYDRLSNGPAFYSFIGYQHLAPNGRINFLVGMDVTWAGVQNRRAFNFDEGRQDNSTKNSLLTGVRIGWILPISTGPRTTSVY